MKIFIATLVMMMQDDEIVYWLLVGAYATGVTSASTTGVKRAHILPSQSNKVDIQTFPFCDRADPVILLTKV